MCAQYVVRYFAHSSQLSLRAARASYQKTTSFLACFSQHPPVVDGLHAFGRSLCQSASFYFCSCVVLALVSSIFTLLVFFCTVPVVFLLSSFFVLSFFLLFLLCVFSRLCSVLFFFFFLLLFFFLFLLPPSSFLLPPLPLSSLLSPLSFLPPSSFLPPPRERSRKTHVERGSLLLTPCLACLGVACSWSRAGPLVTRSSLGNPLSTCARLVSSCVAPDLSAGLFKGDGSLPM